MPSVAVSSATPGAAAVAVGTHMPDALDRTDPSGPLLRGVPARPATGAGTRRLERRTRRCEPIVGRTLAELKADVPQAAGVLVNLLGCEWGRSLKTDDDAEPCEAQATRMVALHWDPADDANYKIYKLCDRHDERFKQETDSHGPGAGA